MTRYSDSEFADFSIRVMQGESLDILPEDLRPRFERVMAEARAFVDAEPPPREYPVIKCTPHVWELLCSLAKAAGVRRGEFPKWLAEAQAADAAELAPSPEPSKLSRPRLLALNGHGLAPTPHPRPRHLRAVPK